MPFIAPPVESVSSAPLSSEVLTVLAVEEAEDADVDDVVDCVEAQPAKISAERMTAKRRVCFFVDKRFGFMKEGSFPYSCSTGVCGWPQRTSRLPLRQRSASRNPFSLRSSARRTR